MPSNKQSTSSSQRSYFDAHAPSASSYKSNREVDQHWTVLYSIDDEDLTFDGKPLCEMLEEERETERRGREKYVSALQSFREAEEQS